METVGILSGLAAAFCQSLSYVFTRTFVVGRPRAVLRLLAMSHILMAVLSGVVLWLLPDARLSDWTSYVLPMVGAALFYLAGQMGMFCVVMRTDSSRVAPLLGLKIAILALISVTFLGEHLQAHQWTAVAMSVVAALVLSRAGGLLSGAVVFWLSVACVAYSLSDLCIAALVRALDPAPTFRTSVTAVCATYLLCGVFGAALLPVVGVRALRDDWKPAIPFALSWWLSMVFLFTCFGLVGPVYGNVLQATRGVISIAIGAILARWGLFHLQGHASAGVLVRRFAAAVLMCLAIWMFRS